MVEFLRTFFSRILDDTSSPSFIAKDSGNASMMDNIQFMCFKRAMDLAAPKDVRW
jgi:hypothetical protein